MKFIKAFQLLILGMIISLPRCAGQSTVSKEEPVPTPSADETATGDVAELFVFNTSGWTFIPEEQQVLDNGKKLASLPRNTYSKSMIAPGEHTFGFPGRQKPNLTLDVVKRKTYYVLVAYTPKSSWAWHSTDPIMIKQISKAEAIALMKTCDPTITAVRSEKGLPKPGKAGGRKLGSGLENRRSLRAGEEVWDGAWFPEVYRWKGRLMEWKFRISFSSRRTPCS